ncbi:MAG: hypothetical protein FJW34_01915 [Acidobacteria bacterium]|nr:hypothetical protein [Acidobacteriota bacterium]
MKIRWGLAISLLLCLARWSVVEGQINTGTIVGVVNDTQGLVVAGAEVTLTSERTGDIRRTVTNEVGAFTVPAVPTGTYTLRVSTPGFQAYERRGMVLTSNQYLSAGTIQLAVGTTTETVTVTAAAAVVQTASAENAALLDNKQMSMMLTRGRDVISLLRLLPGVAHTHDEGAMGGRIGSGSPSIGGLRNNDNTISLDGQVSSDADNVNVHISSISLDAIEEVTVLLNNYQAEYGRNAGAHVNIISKSGTQEFHGTASWFKRHEQFNANAFFNNRNNLPRPVYRHNNWSGTLGGPLYLPRRFNANKDRLFFFFVHDEWGVVEPQPVWQRTIPTRLERAGDFSQTLDLNDRLITVFDPLTQTPFPGNIVPASRINPHGRAILNIFNEPNFLDRGISRGNYNYQFQDVRQMPKRLDQLKVDWNATSSDRVTARWRKWKQITRGYAEDTNFGPSGWDLMYGQYFKTEDSGVLHYTRTFSPTVVNEFSFSYRQMGELGMPISDAHLAPVTRAARNLSGLKQFYPEANPYNVVPSVTFGGVPNAATVSYDARFPIDAGDTRWSLANNAAWTKLTHLIKAGFYFESNISDEGLNGPCFSGCFAFNVDRNNFLDANQAYANAILGVFRSYSESSARGFRGGENWLLEWFAQDSWKVNRKLTLELGMRFSLFTPWMPRKDQKAAAWVLERFDTSKIVQYYQPAFDAQKRRVAQNPLTGELAPAVLIGAFVPGSGDPFNGMVLADDRSVPRGWQERPPVQLGPRFGFAYDAFGNGKTAIRGAFGATKQTQINSAWANANIMVSPPVVLQPTVFYSTIDALPGSAGSLFPAGTVRSFERKYKPATVYSYSFGIQRDVGFDTVVGVRYVGNAGRHLLQTRNLNTLPYGTRFLPESADPTNPGRPLPDPFLTRYRGYQTITAVENSGISNYNSLQVTANRRFAQGLQFGAAWTWSKAMNLSDGVSDVPMYRPARVWLYGKAGFDQTHVLVLNYVWDLPKASRAWDNLYVKAVFDGWQLSGFATFASGFPSGVSYSTVDGADITGGGDGARINVTGKAPLPHGQRTFDQWFDASVFARPARGDWGNAPKDVFRRPGINNWDISLFKNIPLKSEARVLQFRSEFYNAFNHTQFSSVDTSARFDAAGRQVNQRFGQVTGARSPRVIQFALSLRF